VAQRRFPRKEHATDFEEISDEEERDRVRKVAYERVRAFLALLR
jgi:hypothetical protein